MQEEDKTAKKYHELKTILDELTSLRNDPEGAIIDYISGKYAKARELLEYFSSESGDIRQKLEIGSLEKDLLAIGNIHVNL